MLSCLFDSATVVFVVFEALSSSLGWSLRKLFTVYLLVGAASFGVNVLLWAANPKYNRTAKQARQAELDASDAIATSTAALEINGPYDTKTTHLKREESLRIHTISLLSCHR